MTIPNPLPQFIDSKVLIVAAGRQRARFYSARKSEIREIDFIEIETPKYSDREGFFARTGKNMSYGSGAPYENKKQKIQNDFLKEMENKLKKLLPKYDEVYLFCPNYMHKMIESTFPKGKERMLKNVFFGNIVDTNPLKFIEKIDARKERRVAIIKRRSALPEVKKLLKKKSVPKKAIKKS